MPARGVCQQPGCPELKPCPHHTPKPWAGSTRRKRLPSDWNRRRAAVLRRDNHTCQSCGTTANEVDHIKAGDDHGLGNLQALCGNCHRAKTLSEATAARTRNV